jgi:hypothetical protein
VPIAYVVGFFTMLLILGWNPAGARGRRALALPLLPPRR